MTGLVLGSWPGVESDHNRFLPILLGALEAEQTAAVEMPPAPEPAPMLPSPEPIDPITAKREDVMALAAEQPAEVADALRGWLVGSRR